MKRLLVITLAVASCALVYGADKTPQTQTKASQEKASYIEKANKAVEEWNAKIQDLQKRSENSGSKTRQEVDHHMKAVDDTMATIRIKIRELTASSETAWTHFRVSLDKAFDDMQHHYKKAESTLEKGKKKEKS